MSASETGDGEHSDYLAMRRFGSLDGLRCASIVAVVWHHARRPEGWPDWLDRGFLGVDLFFAISGFLIVTLLLRERDARGGFSLRDFYLRRALRIFPPYYGLLLVVAAYLLLFRENSPLADGFWAAWPYYLTYTSNWIPPEPLLYLAWSLATEEQFYLLWPPLERLLRRRWWLALAVGLAACQLVNFGVILAASARELFVLQATFTPILLGVLLAHLLHEPAGYRGLRAVLGRPAAPLLILAAFAAVQAGPGPLAPGERLAAQLLLTALVGACVVREDHLLAPLLRLRPVAAVGLVSYGIYLCHALVHGQLHGPLERAGVRAPGVDFALTLGVSTLLAGLSYRYYERPFLRLKERFGGPGGAGGVAPRSATTGAGPGWSG